MAAPHTARRAGNSPQPSRDGELLTYRQLAGYLAYQGKKAPEAARKFVARNGLRRFWRGGAWLVRVADVNAVIEGRPAARSW